MIEATSGKPIVPVSPLEPVRPVQPQFAPRDETSAGRDERAVEVVEKALRQSDPPVLGQHERLSILRDEETGTFIYRSIDRNTGEVLRQWPVESMLQFKAYLRHAEGVLIDSKV